MSVEFYNILQTVRQKYQKALKFSEISMKVQILYCAKEMQPSIDMLYQLSNTMNTKGKGVANRTGPMQDKKT